MVASGRSARRYGSPALASNAVHFASDLAGSLAVLVGTILVATGRARRRRGRGPARRAARRRARAAAAVAVGAGADGSHVDRRRGAHPRRARRAARAARAAPRARPPRGRPPLRRPRRRRRARQGRRARRTRPPTRSRTSCASALGNADVVVHVEPVAPEGGLRERATAAAARVPEVREVHNVRVMRVGDALRAVAARQAPARPQPRRGARRDRAARDRGHGAVPELRSVHTHIEPLSRTDWASAPPAGDTAVERAAVEETVRGITGSLPGVGALPRRRARPRRARHDHAAGRPAAAVGPPPRRADRGGGARALPGPRGRDRAHGARPARPQRRLIAADERDREQHAGVAEVARDQQDQADDEADADRGQPRDAVERHAVRILRHADAACPDARRWRSTTCTSSPPTSAPASCSTRAARCSPGPAALAEPARALLAAAATPPSSRRGAPTASSTPSARRATPRSRSAAASRIGRRRAAQDLRAALAALDGRAGAPRPRAVPAPAETRRRTPDEAVAAGRRRR